MKKQMRKNPRTIEWTPLEPKDLLFIPPVPRSSPLLSGTSVTHWGRIYPCSAAPGLHDRLSSWVIICTSSCETLVHDAPGSNSALSQGTHNALGAYSRLWGSFQCAWIPCSAPQGSGHRAEEHWGLGSQPWPAKSLIQYEQSYMVSFSSSLVATITSKHFVPHSYCCWERPRVLLSISFWVTYKYC